jgi:hypothetical protein
MAKPKDAGDGKAKGAAGAAKKAAKEGVARRNGAPAPADPPAVKEGSTSPRARKAAEAKGAAARARPAPARRASLGATTSGPDLRADLRSYASARPEGWNHDDWLSFLAHLSERGHDTSDAESIGRQLERERLGVMLERIAGMGPRRVQTLVERYDTLYSARRADVDELAALPGMNRALAEKVRQAFG